MGTDHLHLETLARSNTSRNCNLQDSTVRGCDLQDCAGRDT